MAKELNERMAHHEENYSVKDKQDLLAMSALQLLSETRIQEVRDGDEKASQKIASMESVIDSCLT